MNRIALARRVSQTLCFILIVFGGFLFVRPLDHGQAEIVDESGYGGKYERGRGVRWVEREPVRVDAYLPATSCYYQHKGMFTGCSLAFLAEHLTWLTPVVEIVPHLLLLLLLMFAAGRLWCGWVCPFGFLGDLLTGLRKLIGLDHLQLPRSAREALVWTKYLLLLSSLTMSILGAVPALSGSRGDLLLPFCQVCVGKIVSPLLSGASICWTNFRTVTSTVLTILGFLALGALVLSFFVRRLYCRICPIGGLSAPFNRYGMAALHKRARKCTRCGACARVCPVDNLTVFEGDRDGPVSACECTMCLRCVESCPEPDCLERTFLGKRVVASAARDKRTERVRR